jgi:hypothetical protein
MIRFVDLKTGNIFNAGESYVFWFDGEQSINMLYSKPICFVSDSPVLSIEFPKNDIFRLVDVNKLKNMDVENIHNFEYFNINKMCLKGGQVMNLNGYAHNNYYVYMIYVIASSQSAGEAICSFKIANETFKVGADFYGSDETLYINLSNQGVDIPEAIQKALYNVNVHEDKIDNITLNRKWKELLSNYWDILANKGSYKSLYNSLKWFEYGDLVKIGEIWKNKDHYEIRDIQSILSDKYIETLTDFTKTTYEGLYLCLSELTRRDGKVVYDKEKNPTIQSISFQWSKEDLALKMSMLGSFFETYFMPIHLDLIHSTIEDIVYTNTFKQIAGTTRNRVDFVYDIQDIDCSVKDGDIFHLNPVQCYVGADTLFHSIVEDTDPIIIGVQRNQPIFDTVDGEIPNDDLKTYLTQLFYEVGSVVDFNIVLPLAEGDFIKHSIISVPKTINGVYQRILRETHKPLGKNISFSLLFEDEGEYDVRMQFESVAGKTFVKRVVFNVIDTDHVGIQIFKVQNIGCPMASFDRETRAWKYGVNDYIFSRQVQRVPTGDKFQQYIPAKIVNPYEVDYDGVCLNHMMILTGDWTHDLYLYRNYFTMLRKTEAGPYTICISRQFGFRIDPAEKAKYQIYRESYTFMPEFHKLVELGSERGNKIEDLKYYTITDDDTLCVMPDIAFGKCISASEWEFINMSSPTHKSLTPGRSVKEPFIASNKNEALEPGYYKVVFRYSLSNGDVNEIVLDSAFRKV